MVWCSTVIISHNKEVKESGPLNKKDQLTKGDGITLQMGWTP